MELATLKDLFIDQLKDIYSAEKQMMKALPKMAEGASSENLKQAFLDHLKETETQAQRIEKILGSLDEKAGGKTCAAMEGLVEEGSEILETEGTPAVLDAAIIGAAQKVEHYEIASYGTAKAFALLLDLNEAAELLQTSLSEEEAADKKLNDIAENEVNELAVMNFAEDDDAKPAKNKKASRSQAWF